MDLDLAKAAAASAVCPSPLPKVILGHLKGLGTHLCHTWAEVHAAEAGAAQGQVGLLLSLLVLPATRGESEPQATALQEG